MTASTSDVSNREAPEVGSDDCELNAVVVGNKLGTDVVGENRGLLTDPRSALELEPRWVLRSACYMCVSILIAYLGGMATMWVLMRPAPSVAERKPCKVSSSSGLFNASDAPASYGFVYTEEGQAILQDLLTTARDQGTRPALTKAEQLLTHSRHFLDACHPLLHRLGRALYFEADKDRESLQSHAETSAYTKSSR